MTTEEDLMQGPSSSEEKIFVSVRLRPLNEKERVRNDVPDWECISNTTIIYRNHLSISERSMYPSAYTFDRVFGPDCCTRQVYDQGAKEVAVSVVSGVNASVFAYGQTSSGKTYTMSGITDCALVDIYDYIEKHKEREFILKFSAMEIYNESVRDLLSTDSSPLRLLDDPEKGTVVEKLTEETLQDWNHFKELLSVCEAQRQIGETALNEISSRSHQILRLTVESTAREFFANDKFSTLTATVNFIDLAGSERASQSLSAGTRLKEGCHINRSLLTLGTVIRKLSKGKTGHIPFRDSKLTRILQSSLGGNARTAIICTMSPARIHVEQSRNTLLFASCAKEVTTNAQVNVVMSDKALVKHLQRELAKLESELRSPGQASVISDTTALLTEKDLEVERLRKEVYQLTQQLEQARCEIEALRRMVGEETLPEKMTLSTEAQEANELLEHQYPRLRVRRTWGSEDTTPLSPVSVQPSYVSPRSEYSYEENVFHLSDFMINSGSSSPLDISETESKGQSHVHIEEIADQPHVQEERFCELAEQTNEDSEDNCREVRCIEIEKSDITTRPEQSLLECSPDRYEVMNAEKSMLECSPDKYGVVNAEQSMLDCSPDRYEVVRAKPVCVAEDDDDYDDDEEEEEEVEEGEGEGEEEEEERVKEVGGASPHPKQEIKVIETSPRCDFPSPEKCCPEEFDKNMSNLGRNKVPPDFTTPSHEMSCSWHMEWDSQPFTGVKLTRSRSCRANFISGSSSPLFEKDADTPPSWYEKEFVETAKRSLAISRNIKNERLFQDDFSRTSTPTTSLGGSLSNTQTADAALDGVSNGMSSPKESNSRPSDASVLEFQTSAIASISEEKPEETAAQKDKQIIHLSVQEMEQEFLAMSSVKNVKDAGVDPIQDYLATPLNWSVEFKRLQREIIELWHACNISMAHRSYFFLLFKGDQKDCLYLEVELRRLKYTKESLTQHSKVVHDGRTLTLMSSAKALERERYKLSKLMQRKLSQEERENLFLRWGIRLHTKHRCVQLAQRLWSNYKDMRHVRESASVVGRLLGFVDMNVASKEMFGLNFALKPPRPKKTSFWKRSVLSLSFL